MSWIERLENTEFTITTGDGKVFTPLWKNGSKSKNYNFAKFDFIDVNGSYIARKKPESSKYPLIFWFQGDDNIDQAEEFEQSADDNRPWTINHPFYGVLNGQPTSISRVDDSFNATQIVVEFWESVSDDYPNPRTAVDNIIFSYAEELQTTASENYSENLNPNPEDVQTLQDSISQISSSFDNLLNDLNISEYLKIISEAEKAANDLISSPLNAITAINNLVLTPSLFTQSVKSRINALTESFDKLFDIIDDNDNVSTKLFFEAQNAVTLGAICQSAASPLDSDYVTRNEIEEINTTITTLFNKYQSKLDEVQVNIDDFDNAYHANTQTQQNLYKIVTEITGNLFNLAFSAKQERTVELEKDSNLIVLTHRFLGLDASDENIEKFRENNNIKNDKIFRIEKGTLIKYFV